MKKRTKIITLVATAITTLLSATVAVVAISIAKKGSTTNDELKKENGELKTVLDGLVNVGIITGMQEVAIRRAFIASKEAAIANGEFPGKENSEHQAILIVNATGTLMKLKKSFFRARSQQLKKPTKPMTGL